jgi:transposase
MEPSSQNCGRPPALTDAELAEMKKIVEGQNDITLEELKEKMHLSICISAISRILRFKLGFNYKKTMVATERNTEKNKRERETFIKETENIPGR